LRYEAMSIKQETQLAKLVSKESKKIRIDCRNLKALKLNPCIVFDAIC